MISIVIPLYNKEKSIVSTMQTVLKQTYQNFEIIVVNDGSTDNSAEEVAKVKDSRIRLIHQHNAGVSAARNKGIEEAKGKYIAFLDADDEWNPEYLETQYRLTKKYPKCSVFASNYEFKDIQGKITHTIIRKLNFEGEDGILCNYFEIASCSHPPLWTSAVIVEKNAIQSIGGFPIGVKSGEDLLTWARLACKYSIVYTKKTQAIYNLGEGYNMKNLPPRKQDKEDPVGKGLLELYKIYPNIRGMRTYISHWHKMRASVAIRYGNKLETIQEVIKGLYYNPFNYKLLVFALLTIIPLSVRQITFIKSH